jgi:hypothetical protein
MVLKNPILISEAIDILEQRGSHCAEVEFMMALSDQKLVAEANLYVAPGSWNPKDDADLPQHVAPRRSRFPGAYADATGEHYLDDSYSRMRNGDHWEVFHNIKVSQADVDRLWPITSGKPQPVPYDAVKQFLAALKADGRAPTQDEAVARAIERFPSASVPREHVRDACREVFGRQSPGPRKKSAAV